jgi:uncharacterized protein HemY
MRRLGLILQNLIDATCTSHGALYKVLGELEAKEGRYAKARELFAVGLSKDPHCAAVYHAAALLEAKLGNLEVSVKAPIQALLTVS